MSLLAMNSLRLKLKGNGRYLWSGRKPFTLCVAGTIIIIIIFQRENLNYLIVCFTQHTAVPCVFNSFDFCCRFVYRVLSVGHMKWGYKCCVVTHCAADILVVSLGLFTFTCIVFLLQLWIKTSNLDYSIWVMPK